MKDFFSKELRHELVTLENDLKAQLYRVQVMLYGAPVVTQSPAAPTHPLPPVAEKDVRQSSNLSEFYTPKSTLKGKVYGLLCENPNSTNRDVAEMLMRKEPDTFFNEQKTVQTVQTYMSMLKREGFVETTSTEGQVMAFRAIRQNEQLRIVT